MISWCYPTFPVKCHKCTQPAQMLDIQAGCSLYLQRHFLIGAVSFLHQPHSKSPGCLWMENKENNSSPASLKELPIGYQFPPIRYELTKSVVAKYLDAVGERQDFLKSGIVPPLAIAACAMTALSQSFAVPPGSIHASQELEFLKVVPVGATISCGGKIAHRLERGRLNLVSIEISALDQGEQEVLTGKATVAMPN